MKKTIIFFHPSSDLYGADKILIYVMKNYQDYNKVLVLRVNGPLIELVQKELPDVKIIIISSLPVIAKKNITPKGIVEFFFSFISFQSKVKKLVKLKPDIVYLNTLAVVPVLLLSSLHRAKKIVHVHEILNNSNILQRTINKIAMKRSDALICVSNAVRTNMELALPEMKDKLYVVHNGINFRNISSIDDNFFQVDTMKLNFVLIGRIKPTHKGQNLLLDAISKLDTKYLNSIHFYFVGDTVPGQEFMLKEVKDKIASLNLIDYVDIVSFITNIEYIYQKIDVVIVPSVFDDPFPTTVLEGMFFSKPIIGTYVGGIPEMIEDKVTGFIVERDNANDLSDKIAYFIENPEQIKKMGSKGKILFSKCFSEENFNESYLNVLNKIIKD
jgi:glycosyltransferase involved in cell wall biosynthesis